ncbi:MAG: baseplate protein [Alphaproteobacteria bacterium]|nr:MAG: baseplate protein [Alphaproteobacteria bacterium]
MQPWSEIPSLDWSPRLGALGEVVEGVADIDQCIRTILTIPLGSIPHRPSFGADLWQYLGQPLPAVLAYLVRDAWEAIEQNEPRVRVTAITPGLPLDHSQTPGVARLTIAYVDRAGTAARTIEVAL